MLVRAIYGDKRTTFKTVKTALPNARARYILTRNNNTIILLERGGKHRLILDIKRLLFLINKTSLLSRVAVPVLSCPGLLACLPWFPIAKYIFSLKGLGNLIKKQSRERNRETNQAAIPLADPGTEN